MAFLQRHQDDAVIDADGGAVGERQIIGPRRQSDIVHDQIALALGNDFADLVFHLLKNLLRGLDPRSGRRADMKLNLPAIDRRKEVAADERKCHDTERQQQQHERSE